MTRDAKSTLIDLCRAALQGGLSYDALVISWPAGIPSNEFVVAIREDLEDGIAHFPAGLLTRTPLWDEWHRSLEYQTLVVDDELLRRRDVADTVLLDVRQKAIAFLADATPSEEELRAHVRHLLARI